jgi:hypothetical protein
VDFCENLIAPGLRHLREALVHGMQRIRQQLFVTVGFLSPIAFVFHNRMSRHCALPSEQLGAILSRRSNIALRFAHWQNINKRMAAIAWRK